MTAGAPREPLHVFQLWLALPDGRLAPPESQYIPPEQSKSTGRSGDSRSLRQGAKPHPGTGKHQLLPRPPEGRRALVYPPPHDTTLRGSRWTRALNVGAVGAGEIAVFEESNGPSTCSRGRDLFRDRLGNQASAPARDRVLLRSHEPDCAGARRSRNQTHRNVAPRSRPTLNLINRLFSFNRRFP